jgi:hypothetical protein
MGKVNRYTLMLIAIVYYLINGVQYFVLFPLSQIKIKGIGNV